MAKAEGKKRIVVKIGSSSITHEITGNINYKKLDELVRILCDIKSEGKDVVLVSSGAIAVGRYSVGMKHRTDNLAEKQACAAIGQCRLMMAYQKFFAEYNQIAAQVLGFFTGADDDRYRGELLGEVHIVSFHGTAAHVDTVVQTKVIKDLDNKKNSRRCE